MALSASLNVDKVSLKLLFDGETQNMIKLLPDLVSDGSRSLVSLESLKGIWGAFYASLEMQLVNWKSDLFMNPVSVGDCWLPVSLSDPAKSTIVIVKFLALMFSSQSSTNYY